jgi:putative hemolysin
LIACLIAAMALAIPLLALVTLVQVLYLESLRLRPRDLPALVTFKKTLEDRLGLKTELGAEAFSVIKHALLALVGVLCLGLFTEGEAWGWAHLWQSVATALMVMAAASYGAPQLLYRRTTCEWLLPLVPLLKALALIARPAVAVLDFYQSLIELAGDTPAGEEPPTPAENIEALITAGAEEGLIEEQDRELMQSVLEFGDKTVREVMTPRPNIVAIQADATLEQLRQLVISEQFSRIPVYEKDIDEIIGFVHVRDMFEISEEDRTGRRVRGLARPVLPVPETKPVSELMRTMQQQSTHMVIVVDEYGNTAGLATMEDLLEVIIGEIRDEHEPESDVEPDGDGFIVSGSFDVARVSGLFREFRRDEDTESTTVGGLVSEWLGRVPKPGEFVDRDGVRIEVLAGGDLRVEQVRIRKSQTVSHE